MNETLGWNFILVGNLMRSFLSPEQVQFIDSINPEAWYPADDLVALILSVEKSAGVDKVKSCGRGIYYTLKDKLEQMGIQSPSEAIRSIVVAYPQNNRGLSIGGWSILAESDYSAAIETNNSYGCAFNEGVVLGAVKAFGGRDVVIKHIKCRKKGDDTCLYEVTWTV